MIAALCLSGPRPPQSLQCPLPLTTTRKDWIKSSCGSVDAALLVQLNLLQRASACISPIRDAIVLCLTRGVLQSLVMTYLCTAPFNNSTAPTATRRRLRHRRALSHACTHAKRRSRSCPDGVFVCVAIDLLLARSQHTYLASPCDERRTVDL